MLTEYTGGLNQLSYFYPYIVWTAGWVELCDKCLIVTIIHLSQDDTSLVGPPTTYQPRSVATYLKLYPSMLAQLADAVAPLLVLKYHPGGLGVDQDQMGKLVIDGRTKTKFKD